MAASGRLSSASTSTTSTDEINSSDVLASENSRSIGKYWCLTIFCDADVYDVWRLLTSDDPCPIEKPTGCVYMACQIERCPSTGRLHAQTYMCFESNRRFAALKRMYPTSHIEKARGTCQQNVAYCTKVDSRIAGPWTIGVIPRSNGVRGARTDWADVRDMISAGSSLREVYTAAPHLARCSSGVDVLYEIFSPTGPVERPVVCCFLTGLSGVGKSHRVRTAFPDAFVITGRYYDGKSFDQYKGQDVLVLDEWRSVEWPVTLMNGILDKWSLQLQCRYRNKMAAWTRVIVCCNEDPMYAYTADPTFVRRIRGRVIVIVGQHDPEVDLAAFLQS